MALRGSQFFREKRDKSMTADEKLEGLTQKIQESVRESGRYMVTHPAEVSVLHQLGEEGVRRYATDHHWAVVPHLAGEQFEFYVSVPGQTA